MATKMVVVFGCSHPARGEPGFLIKKNTQGIPLSGGDPKQSPYVGFCHRIQLRLEKEARGCRDSVDSESENLKI